MQDLQKRCPHNVTTGSVKVSRQIRHAFVRLSFVAITGVDSSTSLLFIKFSLTFEFEIFLRRSSHFSRSLISLADFNNLMNHLGPN